MILREVKTDDDLDQIRGIYTRFHKDDFPIPTRYNILGESIAENGTGIVAYGMVKILAEPIMILDTSKSLREKCEAFKLLIEHAIQEARNAHLEQLYIVVTDENFANILRDHFKFEDVEGSSLALIL